MRLLNCKTFKLQEFFRKPPPYAILSHTWGDEEVTFQDIQSGQGIHKAGFAKIKGCCELALRHGFEYVWIDTCCIDKTSSAELSEAINSMYRWYKGANICYAYLVDIETRLSVWDPCSNSAIDDMKVFRKSRWFTRGWTLQELIAPNNVEFYASDWTEIGTKSSLDDVLSAITGVGVGVLRGDSPGKCNIAERMSWASERQTTREEDMAYCLLGLFGVHMPLLYGEGNRAFIRLQEEILKNSEDHTLFAWIYSIPKSDSFFFDQRLGLLPNSVSLFGRDQHLYLPQEDVYSSLSLSPTAVGIRRNPVDFSSPPSDPPRLTSRGLRITLPLWEDVEKGTYSAYIRCATQSPNVKGPHVEILPLCITLHVLTPKSHLFVRKSSDGFLRVARWEDVSKYQMRTIFVAQPDQALLTQYPAPSLLWRASAFVISTSTPDSNSHLSILKCVPQQVSSQIYVLCPGWPSMVSVLLQWGNTDLFLVRAGENSTTSYCDIFVCGGLDKDSMFRSYMPESTPLPDESGLRKSSDRATGRLHSGLGVIQVAVRRRPTEIILDGDLYRVFSLEISVT